MMNRMTPLGFALGATLAVAAAACAASVPPAQLVDARAAYAKAAQGPATALNPAQLYVAKQSLDLAEKSFVDDGDSEVTRNRAYVASRKAELAAAVARTMETEARAAAASRASDAADAQEASSNKAELKQTKEQLAGNQTALAVETQRREAAEKRATQALADLGRIASVKQEPRGLVITLSGSVLFASNKYELLPAAQAKLSEVSEALGKGDPEARFVVEGHTDSQGLADANQQLSQRRAEAVRAYLVGHGIAEDRVTAQGLGPSRPIAPNTTAEGRANNRRVEIIVQAPGAALPSATK